MYCNIYKMEFIDGRYICKLCNKKYASYKSLWNHNKKYHNGFITENNGFITENNILNKTKLNCKYCNKLFKCIQNRYEHEKKVCGKKINNNNKDINNIIESKLEEFKNNIFNILQKNAKIHPKTLQKINKQLINNTTNNNSNNNITNNTINNTTINNTVNIKFGSEKLSGILNEKEMINILNNCKMCVEESIKVVHFNDDRPEFRNILITNLRDNVAYIFDGNRFVAQNKDYILTELFDKHYGNIENHVLNNEFMRKLNDSILCKYLIEFINQINGDQSHIDFKNKDGYKIHKINELKNLIYNYSDPKILKN